MTTALDLRTWLAARIAAHLGHGAADLAPDVLLAEYGLDSVHAMALAADIEDEWGLPVDPAITWDHPTIADLAAFLTGELAATRTHDESAG